MDNIEAAAATEAKKPAKRMSLDQLLESGKAQVADLVEAQLRVGASPFGKGTRFLSRDGNFCVRAEDENGDRYVIETKLRPRYQDMYQQIYADLRREQDALRQQASDKKVIIIVCSNAPSELVVKAAKENPDIRIFRFFLDYDLMKL